MVKWFDKSTERYMKSISKEDDLEIGMARRVYYEKMTPEDAVINMLQQHEGFVSVQESIDAWNRVVAKNQKSKNVSISLFLFGILLWILAFLLAL